MDARVRMLHLSCLRRPQLERDGLILHVLGDLAMGPCHSHRNATDGLILAALGAGKSAASVAISMRRPDTATLQVVPWHSWIRTNC